MRHVPRPNPFSPTSKRMQARRGGKRRNLSRLEDTFPGAFYVLIVYVDPFDADSLSVSGDKPTIFGFSIYIGYVMLVFFRSPMAEG